MILPNDNVYETVRDLLPRLRREEKVRLLQDVASELHSHGIAKTPGVCGGAACVRDTRIPVWMLEEMRRLGSTEAQLLHAYPSLTAEDLVAAWAYVEVNRSEIDESIRLNRAA